MIRDDLFLGIRIRVVTDEPVIEVRICTLNEPDVRAIILRKPFAVDFPAPVAAGHDVIRRITKAVAGAITVNAVVWIEEEVARRCSQRLDAESGLLVQAETAIEAQDLVVLVDKVITRGDHANRVFLADVALQSQHANVGVLVEEPLVVANNARVENTLFEAAIQSTTIVSI